MPHPSTGKAVCAYCNKLLGTLADVEILTSHYSIAEVSRKWTSPDACANLWCPIYLSHRVPEGDSEFLHTLVEPPGKDRPMLASAIVAQADVLITGDMRPFANYYGKQLHGVSIELPETFRERYPTHVAWD